MESRGRSRVRSRSVRPMSRSATPSRASRTPSRSRSRWNARMGARRGAQLATRNLRTAGFLGREMKFFDTAVAPVAIVNSATMAGGEVDPTALPGAVLCLNAMAQDDTPSGRDGRRVILKSVQVTGKINLGASELAASPVASMNVFVALVLDTQTNAAQLNSEDVYINTSASLLMGAEPQRNLLFGNRFVILKKETFNLDPLTLSHFAADSFSTAGRSVTFDWFKKIDIPVNMIGTTAVIANVVDNSLHMLAFTDTAGGNLTIAYNSRVRFVG